MRLLANWREVLQHAWSIRLMILAGLLTGAEYALPLVGASLPISPRTVDLLTAACIAAAFVARLIAQRIPGEDC